MNVTVCPICFEKLQSPRSLSCSHTLCQNCLSKHIQTLCQENATPLGLHCPLCREFTPGPPCETNIEKWAGTFPRNAVVEYIVQNGGEEALRLCKPCQNDSAEEEASSFCKTCIEPLCEACTKHHRKLTITKHHEVIPLIDILKNKGLLEVKEQYCRKHGFGKVDMFCFGHEEAFCSVCCFEEHRGCLEISTLENAVTKVEEEGKSEIMVSEINYIQTQLKKFKSDQEAAQSEVENQADQIAKDTTEFRLKINEVLDQLEEKHLEDIARGMKSTRKAIEGNIKIFSDMIDLSRYCKTFLTNPKRKENSSSYVEGYYKTKKHIKRLQSANLCLKNVKISSGFSPLLKKIKKLDHFASLEIEDKSRTLNYPRAPHIPKAFLKELETIIKIPIDPDNYEITDICLLDNEELIVCSNNKVWLIDNFGIARERHIAIDYSIDRVAVLKNKIFILNEIGDIHVYEDAVDSSCFRYIEKFPVTRRCYGISVLKDSLFLGSVDVILQLDNNGNEKRSLCATGVVCFITVLRNGNIVYASHFTNEHEFKVRSMNTKGEEVWIYEHMDFKVLGGLSKDCAENIYVAACSSNNIHVISCALGETLKIFENFPKPTGIIFKKDSNECYLVNSPKTVKRCKVEEEPLELGSNSK